jgi:hypothetical protein
LGAKIQNSQDFQSEIPKIFNFEAVFGDGESKCDFLVLSGDNWREKKFLLGDKSA